MVQFQGKLNGQSNNTVTRLGNKAGMTVQLNGWDTGVKITSQTDDDGHDWFVVEVNGGSNGAGSSKTVLTVHTDGLGNATIEHTDN